MSEIASKSHTTGYVTDEKTQLGFWIYLMTDCILFASLFATYAVLYQNTAGGASASSLFDLPFVLVETIVLLTSSYATGLMLLALRRGQKERVLAWLGVVFVLGCLFLGMELYEFRHLVVEGSSWRESAFLSAFFTLVGTHGAHILVGLIWLVVLFFRVTKTNLQPRTTKQLTLFSIFWHFLDVIWIFIFTIVYLLGVVQS